MISTAEIREHLIGRLEPLFGKVKSADGLAAELAKHIPEHATVGGLDGLADRIIQTRKAKSFPAASEMITAIKGIAPAASIVGGTKRLYTPADYLAKRQAEDKAEADAVRLLAGTDLARRAVEERWAPGLLDFTTTAGRAPALDEERVIKAKVYRNDAMVEEDPGVLGDGLITLRHWMHVKACRLLGFPIEEPRPTTKRVPTRFDMRPMKELPPVTAEELAPTPQLLATLRKLAPE